MENGTNTRCPSFDLGDALQPVDSVANELSNGVGTGEASTAQRHREG
jgi:hypothetical protein